MDLNLMNISNIETYLNSLIDGKISENSFPSDLPTTIDSTWNDMVVFTIPTQIKDMGGYGQGTILIFLYAKPMKNGKKNVTTMSSLEKKLNDVLLSMNDKHYRISRRGIYEDYDEARNLHCNIVELNLLII